MMAMSLYGDSNSAASANPYLAPHALHHGGRLSHNPIELGARRLPRPRKSRKKREKEKPLYPSIAAVEEAVPEAIISVQDNGTLEIRLPKEEEDNKEEAMQEMETAGAEEADDAKPAAAGRRKTSRVSSNNSSNSSIGSGSTLSSGGSTTVTPGKLYKAQKHRSGSTTSSLLGKPRRRCSNSSEKLDQTFRKLSIKRKPQASAFWDEESYDEDDPLGGTALTMAPRRKVSRQGSRDSLHSRDSRASADSGDSSSVSSSMSSVCQYLPTSSSATTTSNNSGDSRIGSTLNLNTGLNKPGSLYGCPSSGTRNNKSSKNNTSALNSFSFSSSKNNKNKSPVVRRTSNDQQELEIEPGLFLPLRGTDETMAAIKTGFVEEIFCQACDIELICIADANFCVCPECKCVSSVDGIASLTSKSQGTVGLGLRASSQR